MLALLAARATTQTSRDWIGEAIWPDQPAETARGSAQTILSQLRHQMAVASSPDGYQLDRRSASVDAYEFERLAGGESAVVRTAIADRRLIDCQYASGAGGGNDLGTEPRRQLRGRIGREVDAVGAQIGLGVGAQ